MISSELLFSIVIFVLTTKIFYEYYTIYYFFQQLVRQVITPSLILLKNLKLFYMNIFY